MLKALETLFETLAEVIHTSPSLKLYFIICSPADPPNPEDCWEYTHAMGPMWTPISSGIFTDCSVKGCQGKISQYLLICRVRPGGSERTHIISLPFCHVCGDVAMEFFNNLPFLAKTNKKGFFKFEANSPFLQQTPLEIWGKFLHYAEGFQKTPPLHT